MRQTTTTLSFLAALACATAAHAHAPCHPVATSGQVTVELIGEHGQRLPTYQHGGQIWVLGQMGHRYSIRVNNGGSGRLEIVASVDGRDVLDGRPASWTKRGYLVPAYGNLLIDGFRLSSEDVASFRFTDAERSYAARMGHTRDIGVVGIAVFHERRYAPPPRPRYHGWDDWEKDGDMPSAERSEAPSEPGAGEKRREEAKAGARPAPPGLGTGFGERRSSPVREVPFERASYSPDHMLSLRYDDAAGLQDQGVDLACRHHWHPNEPWRRATARPFVEPRGEYSTPPPGWEHED